MFQKKKLCNLLLVMKYIIIILYHRKLNAVWPEIRKVIMQAEYGEQILILVTQQELPLLKFFMKFRVNLCTACKRTSRSIVEKRTPSLIYSIDPRVT